MLKGLLLRPQGTGAALVVLLIQVAGFFLLHSCVALTTPAVVGAPAELNPAKTPDAVAARTKVQADSFKNTTFIIGPTFHAKDDIYGVHWHLWTRVGDDTCYLSLNDLRRDWAFFEHAADSKGKQFQVVQQDRRVVARMVEERLYLSFPPGYLMANAESGTTIKIWGLRGQEVIEVPGYYLTGFLKAAAAAAR
jgi:hypothetical protein